MTIKWKRPSGAPFESNDDPEAIKYLESLGYTRIPAKKAVKKAPKKAAK